MVVQLRDGQVRRVRQRLHRCEGSAATIAQQVAAIGSQCRDAIRVGEAEQHAAIGECIAGSGVLRRAQLALQRLRLGAHAAAGRGVDRELRMRHAAAAERCDAQAHVGAACAARDVALAQQRGELAREARAAERLGVA
ncbi:hypothetical protein, partial [Paenibacillus selenitireducens]|uniref:hypothetical protein n=1 Tax=Paenibacillus selenitireducens TaxID=1324314 RepID=UPI001E527EEB